MYLACVGCATPGGVASRTCGKHDRLTIAGNDSSFCSHHNYDIFFSVPKKFQLSLLHRYQEVPRLVFPGLGFVVAHEQSRSERTGFRKLDPLVCLSLLIYLDFLGPFPH